MSLDMMGAGGSDSPKDTLVKRCPNCLNHETGTLKDHANTRYCPKCGAIWQVWTLLKIDEGFNRAEQWKRELYALQETFNELKGMHDEQDRLSEEKDVIISALVNLLKAHGW